MLNFKPNFSKTLRNICEGVQFLVKTETLLYFDLSHYFWLISYLKDTHLAEQMLMAVLTLKQVTRMRMKINSTYLSNHGDRISEKVGTKRKKSTQQLANNYITLPR